MIRLLCVIAGPYAADTPALVQANTDRAARLGRLAVRHGYAPIIPHVHGHAGIYGSAADNGSATDPVRQAALECGIRHVQLVAEMGGELWVLLKPDGTMSSGTRAERDAFVLIATGKKVRYFREAFIEEPRGVVRAGLDEAEVEVADPLVSKDHP